MRGDSGSHRGYHDRPSMPFLDNTGVQDTRMGMLIRLISGRRSDVGGFHVLPVNDEEGCREWGQVYPRLI